MTARERNGPHGRELGAIGARLDNIERTLKQIQQEMLERDRQVREYKEDCDKKIAEMKGQIATVRERIFVLGAAIAVVSGLGGGVVNEYWPKIHERPHQKPSQSLGMAPDYRNGPAGGIHPR